MLPADTSGLANGCAVAAEKEGEAEEEELPLCQRGKGHHATTFTMIDDGDDEEESEEQLTFGGAESCGRRLSAMYEHNDLINNRLSGLAQSIRSGELPLPKRLSVMLVDGEVLCDLNGEASGSEDSANSEASEDRDAALIPSLANELAEDAVTAEAGNGPSAERSLAAPSSPAGSRAETAEQRCKVLEERLRQSEAENLILRTRLGLDESSIVAPLFSPPSRAADSEDQNLGKAGWSKVATAVGKEQRRKQRADRAQFLKSKRRASVEVQQCETIVEQLLDTIEALKSSVAAVPTAVVDRVVLSGEHAAASASELDDSTASQDDGYISELRGAFGDFFSGLTSADAAPEKEEASAGGPSTQWRRVQRLARSQKPRPKDAVMYF